MVCVFASLSSFKKFKNSAAVFCFTYIICLTRCLVHVDSAANDVETPGEHNRPDTSSPDWSKRNDRRSRDRGEKEQEMDRYEREAERERLRKEREHRRKLEDAERAYQTRLRQWERREREKEKERQYEKEKEKDKERKRKKEIRYEEDEDEDDDDSRRRWHRGALDERRRRRLREKEDDLADRLKEEEEVVEAKRNAEEQKLQQQQIDALRLLSGHAAIGSEPVQTSPIENDHKATLQTVGESVHEHHAAGKEFISSLSYPSLLSFSFFSVSLSISNGSLCHVQILNKMVLVMRCPCLLIIIVDQRHMPPPRNWDLDLWDLESGHPFLLFSMRRMKTKRIRIKR